jgi:AraC-like DNA-binding protein
MSNPDHSLARSYSQKMFPQEGVTAFNLHEAGYADWCARGSLRWNLRTVCCPFWFLHYNFKKGSSIMARGRRFSVGPQSLLLVPENISFDCHGAPDFSHLWLCFYLNHPQVASTKKPVSIDLTPALKDLLDDVRKQLVRGAQKIELFHASQALLHCAFSRVFKNHQLHLDSNVKLLTVINFIRHRISRPPSNTELADQAHRSEGAFIRWFKQHIGIPPAQYSLRLRLQHASSLLAFGHDSIDDIAQKCGFANRNHFTRVFSAQFNQGPASFRKNFKTIQAQSR